MTNLIDLTRTGIDAAQSDWRVSAGMILAGVLIGVGKWLWNKRKAREK